MKKVIMYFLIASTIIYGADGSLDLTFGNNGLVITDISGSTESIINDIALQPDTKIVAVGSADIGNLHFLVARYNADGSLDSSFGTAGIVTTDFDGSTNIANAVLIQPNGKIVAAGQALVGGSDDFALARYNPDGSLDPSFGINGLVNTNLGGTDVINALLLQPDGKIIAVGRSDTGLNDFALARYNTNGSLDSSFGTNGIVRTNFGGSDVAFAALLQPDGKIVAVGRSNVSGANDFALARYNTNGSLDTSFGTNGLVLTNFGGADEAAAAVLHPNGTIVAAGRSTAGGTIDFALARYDANGSLDSSFGTNGLVLTNFGGSDVANAVLLQSDGKIIAAGISDVTGPALFALARYAIDGSLDTSFGTDGLVLTSFGGTFSILNGIFLQSDGKLVAGGQTDALGATDAALARYVIPSITISPLARDIRAKYFLLQLY